MMDSTDELYANLRDTEMKFKKACEQVVLLNDKLEGLQRRYDKARNENHRSFRYNLRLKMACVEGVRNAYYEYACEKAERVAELRYEASQLNGGMDDDDEEEEDEDEDDDSDWEREEGEEGEMEEGGGGEENGVQVLEVIEEEAMDAADS